MPVNGILVIDKPAGPTSHDVVFQVRRLLGAKVGHTGTLDPLATGVLPLLLGLGTRLSRFLQADDKEYEAAVELGVSTDTYDREGRVIEQRPVPKLTPTQVTEALSGFIGSISQRPPAYSAVKVGGRKLYELARRGEEVSVPERAVQIHGIDLVRIEGVTLRLVVRCSSGTYIRSLAHDLGAKLGCGAVLASLRRTRVGHFQIDQAFPLSQLGQAWTEKLIPLEEALPDMPRIELAPNVAVRVRHGNPFSAGLPSGLYQLIDQGSLVAIGRSDGAVIQPEVVLAGS